MAPGDDLVYLAQALHHDDVPVSSQIVLKSRSYGGQSYEADVVEFADERVSELLRSSREDELTQVIHRARLVTLDPRTSMGDFSEQGSSRRQVRLVLHTSHPVPGLRVDELRTMSQRVEVNDARRTDAEERTIAAARFLREHGEQVTVRAVAKEAGSHKATVARVLGTPVHTPGKDILYKGMNRLPQSSADETKDTFINEPQESSIARKDLGAPPNACGVCGANQWWERPSGGWVCGVCHPGVQRRAPPDEAKKATA
jgi:hypothetical protein